MTVLNMLIQLLYVFRYDVTELSWSVPLARSRLVLFEYMTKSEMYIKHRWIWKFPVTACHATDVFIHLVASAVYMMCCMVVFRVLSNILGVSRGYAMIGVVLSGKRLRIVLYAKMFLQL